jgi:phosphatidylglycerol---prolipoprotein diacylglyceryl transferase
MYPVLIEFAGFQVTGYGLMLVLAILAGTLVLGAQLWRWELDPGFAWVAMPWVALGGAAGAKLYHLLLNWRATLADPLGALAASSGLVWYGALFGGLAVFYLLVRARGGHLATYLDAAAPALAIGYALGRIGCFLAGDDYGLPTESRLGIAFPNGLPPSTAGYLRTAGADIPASVPDEQVMAVHPTQLYEAGMALVIFVILWSAGGRRMAPGRLFGLYLALYGTARFAVEFIRAKTDRLAVGLTVAQLVSLLLIALAIWLLTRRPGTEPAEASALSAAAPRAGQLGAAERHP